ncbi:hypothetical protein B9Z65_7699 [Elsinoe australis]|uniref:NADH dehydrogenase [ubiquinone] 1 alpha subcomplex subunit 13 n=1 Tax=Elsinoe australis TaxID=40998 RepID=A0A2P8A098_9PEZI|nr:hypothetical protein B9Z65_7699 [Elsinoe australis]
MPQDMPPTGGYEPVQYRRNLPARGFRPAWYLAAVAGIMTYGFYRIGQGIREHNEMAREKMWSRIHLIPVMQAEEDRDQVRRMLADKAREKELLGGESQIYHGDRFVRPTYAATPREITK